jgi:hypothetical protein
MSAGRWPSRSRRPFVRTLLSLLALGAVLGSAWWATGPSQRRVTSVRLALSPQECITECQSRQTDCIQECDGRVSCEKSCVHSGEGCVAHCREAADAGALAPSPTPARPRR